MKFHEMSSIIGVVTSSPVLYLMEGAKKYFCCNFSQLVVFPKDGLNFHENY